MAGPMKNPNPKRDADHAEGFGAVFRTGHIRDVGLRQRQVAGGRSVNGASQEQHPQRRGEGRHDESDERADLAHDQERLAARAIRHAAQQRPGDQLAGGVDADQPADLESAGAQFLGVEGQQRDHDRQAQNVHGHDQEDREQR